MHGVAAKLLQLAVDRRASLKDRTWAIKTLFEGKGQLSREDLIKATKVLNGKDLRRTANLNRLLMEISATSKQSNPKGKLVRHLRPRT
jgi:hypothetical protein